MFSFIPRTWPLRNDGVAEAGDPEWIPRTCPRCGVGRVIGHGRRWRQAHDAQHSVLRIRRGKCKQCRVTITVLPAWALPWTHYSLAARQQVLQRRLEQQMPLEQCSPDTKAGLVADPASLRRWLQRRLVSRWKWIQTGIFGLPTILAWDWWAAARMLIPEAAPA